MKKKVLIMLATGRTGFAAATELLKENYPVRAYVRNENDKSRALAKLGAEICIGGFGDRDRLLKALEGVRYVYYCYPYKQGMADDVALFSELAKSAGIEAIVFMGQRIAEFNDTGSAMTAEVRRSYGILMESGLNVVYFAPGYFADNAFVVTEYILQLGVMPNPFGKGKNPWISIEDMGRCIASLLRNPDPYIGRKLFPTGDRSISPAEMAEVFSRVLGRRIIKVDIPDWLFFRAGVMSGKEFGFDLYAIIQARSYNRQMQMGRFDIEPTDVVRELTGRDPEDFETIARRYFEQSPYRNRSFKTRFSSFLRFNQIPFTRLPHAQMIERLSR